MAVSHGLFFAHPHRLSIRVTHGDVEAKEQLEAIGRTQVWEGGIEARGKCDAATEARDAQEWSGRKGRNGEEPEAGDRDRSVRGASERRQGSAEAGVQARHEAISSEEIVEKTPGETLPGFVISVVLRLVSHRARA